MTIVGLILLLPVSLGAAPAAAHNGCATDYLYGSDPNCRAHWQDFHMQYHWGNAIEASHHDDERARFNSAANRWENATGPDSPWEVHFDTAAQTHVNVVNTGQFTLGVGNPAQEDGNQHIPYMVYLYIKHDIDEATCAGQPCSWYSQTDPSVPNSKYDSWSVWQEETGHAQNMMHWNTNDCGFTMSGCTDNGDSSKRTLSDHVKWHACDPYRREHNAC